MKLFFDFVGPLRQGPDKLRKALGHVKFQLLWSVSSTAQCVHRVFSVVCLCACLLVCMCVYSCECVCVHVFVCDEKACLHVGARVCVCVCVCVYLCIIYLGFGGDYNYSVDGMLKSNLFSCFGDSSNIHIF